MTTQRKYIKSKLQEIFWFFFLFGFFFLLTQFEMIRLFSILFEITQLKIKNNQVDSVNIEPLLSITQFKNR